MFGFKVTLIQLEYLVVASGVVITCVNGAGSSWWEYFSTVIYLPLILWLYGLETHITCKFKEFRSSTRSSGSQGLWCAILIPLALQLGCQTNNYKCSGHQDYLVNSLASVPLLLSALFWLHRHSSSQIFSKANFLITIIISILQLQIWTTIGLANSLVSSVVLSMAFHYAIHWLLTLAPKSFTIGEAVVVAHGIASFCYSSYLNLANQYFQLKIAENEIDVITQVSQVAVLGSGVFVALQATQPFFRSTISFYALACSIAVLIMPGLYFLVWQNPVMWFVEFLLLKNIKIILMMHWFISTSIAILVVAWKQSVGNDVKTVIRKYFHVLVIVAYFPGLFLDQNLLYFASLITFGIFNLIECLRVLNIPPLGEIVNIAFSTFLDEKDQGPLILTHFYLLAGCSLPLWLVPEFTKNFHLAMLSGILAIGIGDTMASIGGTWFGRNRWPETSKTVEGTLFSIGSQFLVCQLLNYSGFIAISNYKCLLGICLSSLLEAFTTEIDNLVLPLYLYILFIV